MAVSITRPNRAALTQCTTRSTRSKRSISSVAARCSATRGARAPSAAIDGGVAAAVGGSDPGVDVVALLFPVAGFDPVDDPDGAQPLGRLVAVHGGDIQANGSAVLVAHGSVFEPVGHDDVVA